MRGRTLIETHHSVQCTRNSNSTVCSVTYLHVIYILTHTYCIVPTLISLNMSFMSVTMMWTFEFSCLFRLFQMVYNLPDESCFLISTVKGQLIMLGKVILPVRRLSRCIFDKDFNVLFSFIALPLQMNWAKDSI